VTYGTDPAAKIRAHSITVDTGGSTFEVTEEGKTLGKVRLVVPGKHNVFKRAGGGDHWTGARHFIRAHRAGPGGV